MYIPFLFDLYGSIFTSSVGDWGINSSIIRLRRDSDNEELEFNSVLGVLDTAGILAWSTTDSVYVTKVFDKSGNGNHAVQTVASYQPRLVDTGTFEIMSNGDYGMYFDGVDDRFDVIDNDGLDITSGNFSLLANFDAISGFIFCRNTNGTSEIQYANYYSGVETRLYLNGIIELTDLNGDEVQKISTFTYDHTNVKAYVDGVKTNEDTFSDNLLTKLYTQIGCRSASADGLSKSSFLAGHINRVQVLFNKALIQAEVTYLTSKV